MKLQSTAFFHFLASLDKRFFDTEFRISQMHKISYKKQSEGLKIA